MRIDAHQHYWKIDRNDYGWITPELPILYRDYLPQHLNPILHKHGIEKTIVVQAAPTLEETDYILELSENSETIAGVVGWLNLEDPSYKAHFQRFRKYPKFLGFRVMIQEMSDPDVIVEPRYIEAFSYFAELDVPVDLLVRSHQLSALIRMLKRVPGLRGVVDHLAKPPIAAGRTEPWASQMAEIAKLPNIYCKLSGMVTEADHQNWKPENFLSYVRHVIEIFGTDRVMFGSDWPVCLLAANYDDVVDVLTHALPDYISAEEKENIFGNNAKKFYKL
jgi:L-fuconolactonase